MTRNYYLLHSHSEYSNLKIIDSINRYGRSLDYAWELGLSGVAMTEHDCVSGSLRYLDEFTKKVTKEWLNIHPNEELPEIARICEELDFKPILGNEIYLTENDIDSTAIQPLFSHLILLAKDKEGFQQIKELSSRAWQRAWMKTILRTPTYWRDLEEIVKGGHLICSTACLGGLVAKTAQRVLYGMTDKEELDQLLVRFETLFGKGNFFIEIQPNAAGGEQEEFNEYMINNYWGQYPFIFTTDAHYLKLEEKDLFTAFLNSKSSKDREIEEFYSSTYIMSADQAFEQMKCVTEDQMAEMINNTKKIASMCEYYSIEQKQVITKIPYEFYDAYKDDVYVFDDVTADKYPVFYDFLHGNNKTNKYLIRLIAHGFNEKYQESWDNEVCLARLEEELWTIKEVSDRMSENMADYFISMAKMIDIMWDKAQSLVGPSRGSAGALFMNFLLGITQLNPIEMELPFVWRFLHPSRPDMPDIDIDTESDKRVKVFNEIQKFFESIGGHVVNICTFGTEGTKSALKTAARGLDIPDEVVSYLTSLIPNERGFDWSIMDCYQGGDDKKPIKEFINTINQYPMLLRLAVNIEGLITRLGVHASGVVAVNGNFVDYNSYMKTSKGQIVSAFDLHDSERMGLIKYDMLTVSALDRIRQTMNYLLEDGVMQWKGSLRDTYNFYLHPSVLDYTSQEMWDKVSNGEITSLFQFDTLVGTQAIKHIQPQSIVELANASSLMRLMGEGELPLDTYVRFKANLNAWYQEMSRYRLTPQEVKVLEKYLKKKKGVGESQEVLMQIVMDPEISGFSMTEANLLRKTIAKKHFDEIAKVRDLFFESGIKQGTSKNLLTYIWDVQVVRQLGYSFSELHTTGYALIALQEMNLATRYPMIYWNTACLSVDASAVDSQDFYRLLEDEIIDIEDEEDKREQNKMDYAKLASALDRFGKTSTIELPDINKSKLGFVPQADTNTILYGLKGISRITAPVITEIIDKRPFASLDDFLARTTTRTITKDKVINLIKCGAFNNIEHDTIENILRKFTKTTAALKKSVTLQNFNMLIDLNLIPAHMEYSANVYKLTKLLRAKKDSSKSWYLAGKIAIPPEQLKGFQTVLRKFGKAPEQISVNSETVKAFYKDHWEDFYNKEMEVVRQWIKDEQGSLLEALNNKLHEDEFNKYCEGGILAWELDSMNYYFSGHPLSTMKENNKRITSLVDIEEEKSDGVFEIKGKVIPKKYLYNIVGTVIDRDKTSGIVVLQTPDGVINLKCYKDLYALYIKESGSKPSQESFFEKGVHLLVSGFQRGATFIPKVYKNLGYKDIRRIVLKDDGSFELINKE